MFCDVKNCKNLAKYLRIIITNKNKRIRFNLCAECNKLNWKIDDNHITDRRSGNE